MKYWDLCTQKFCSADETLYIDHRDFSVLMTHPHTGTLVPEWLLQHLALRERHFSLDNEFYLDDVFPKLGTSLISTINRYAVNLARPRDAPMKYTDIRSKSLLLKDIPADFYEEMLCTYYDPFHTSIEHILERMIMIHGKALLIDCHSLHSIGLPHFPDVGKPRADFVLGTLDNTSCAVELVTILQNVLQAHGFTVALNDPYKGGYITRHYHNDNVHVIQIEVKRSLFMHECLKETDISLEKKDVVPVRNALHDALQQLIAHFRAI